MPVLTVGSARALLGGAGGGPSFSGPYPVDAVGGTAPEAAYGMFLLRAGYNGYCIRVVRASDGATQDIGFVRGVVDWAAIDAFVGWSYGKVSIWYDQSGAGRDAYQPDDVYRMRLYPSNMIGGIRSMTADVTQNLLIPASVAVNGNASSVFILGRNCGLANVNNSLFAYNANTSVAITGISRVGTTATATSVAHGLANGQLIWVQGASDMLYNGRCTTSNVTADTFDFTMTGTPSANAATTTSLQWSRFSTDLSVTSYSGYGMTDKTYASFNPAMPVTHSPQVVGLISTTSATAGTLYVNEDSVTTGRNPQIANPTAGGFIGPAPLYVTANPAGHADFNAVIVYNRALNSTERTALKSAFYSAGNINSAPNAAVVYVGDSMTQGATVLGARPFALLCENTYSRRALTQVVARSGIKLSEIVSGASPTFPTPAQLYRSGFSKNVLHLFAGTNDLAASVAATTIYANHTSFISAAKTAGFAVAVGTILPRGTFTGPQETQRQALNVLILANSAGADAVIDYASIPTLQNTADTAKYTDSIHPTASGHADMAALASPVINSLLV